MVEIELDGQKVEVLEGSWRPERIGRRWKLSTLSAPKPRFPGSTVKAPTSSVSFSGASVSLPRPSA